MYKGKGHLIGIDDPEKVGTGTLLGGQTESPEGEGSVLPVDAGEGPTASADIEAALEGERASDELLVEDVDKQATERKTRRRRRKPKED
jgi:hypothetical protein